MSTIDARKPLEVLHNEWDNCVRCRLGEMRQMRRANVVHGRGTPGRIMVVGSGPNEEDERYEQPLSGNPGLIFEKVMQACGLTAADYFVTNIVACRSCIPRTNKDGSPMTRRYGHGPPLPIYQDEEPPKEALDACHDRLHEEIYINDPVFIMALGQPAARALAGPRATSPAAARDGVLLSEVLIDGATRDPQLTDKKGNWFRYIKGQANAPTVQSTVKYLMLTTFEPSSIESKVVDLSPASDFSRFKNDLKYAAALYRCYFQEVYGEMPAHLSPPPEADDEHDP